MRIAVIGAGIVGVTTAYELAADGHEVTVLERRGSVAAESSFANGGIVSLAQVAPWAPPGLPMRLLRQWFVKHPQLRMRAGLAPGMLPWLWSSWRAGRRGSHHGNRLRLQRLARFSRERLQQLTHSLRLEYEHTQGQLLLLREPADLARAQAMLTLLAEAGIAARVLDADGCRSIEPGLNAEMALHAGVHLPDDEVGNCRQFTHLLRGEAHKLGVQFRFHTTVQRLLPGARPQIVHSYTPPEDSSQAQAPAEADAAAGADTQPLPFEPITGSYDAVVLCNALGAPALLRPHGLRLPLQAVHGYTLTAPLRHHDGHPDVGPRSALFDERHQVSISRLGSRLRVSGMVEIGGALDYHHAGAVDTLYKVLHDWFPGAARMSQAQRWKGARPTLPDGPPVLGASGIAGVWLNLGHGASGWALACGSARLITDAVGGRAPSIDAEGLGVDRLRH